MIRNHAWLSALGLCLVAMLMTRPASAHASLIGSDPPANATAAAPRQISLTFDEEVTPAFSSFVMSMDEGMRVMLKTFVSKDYKTIIGIPSKPLMAGVYKLSWHAGTQARWRMVINRPDP